MLISQQDLDTAIANLRAAGFSKAWILTTTDQSEEVFVVPRRELEPRDLNALTLGLMEVLPGRKIWLAGFREGLELQKLYG